MVWWAVLAICLVCVTNRTVASATIASYFLGNWYGEYREAGVYGGKRYDVFRVLSELRNDGHFRTTHRYYQADQLRFETTTEGTWGVQEDLFWMQCRHIAVLGKRFECDERQEYIIIEASPAHVIYANKQSGRTHRPAKVAADFRLP